MGAAIWVGNGTVAIIAVQKAGLSIAQALWSGLSIFVGFVWGAFVFDEPIKDLGMSFLSLILMVRFFFVFCFSGENISFPLVARPTSPAVAPRVRCVYIHDKGFSQMYDHTSLVVNAGVRHGGCRVRRHDEGWGR